MKPTEFIVENSVIAQEADDMHRDHEVQMARSQMYSAAQAAIEIHRLLRDVSEMEGLEGWVQSKLTLASQYLESVRDYMKYEAVSQEPEMMVFAEEAANYAIESMINEDGETGQERDLVARREEERYDSARNYQGRNTRGDVIRQGDYGSQVVKANPNPPSLIQRAAGKLGLPNTATDALGDPMYKSSRPARGGGGGGGGGAGGAGGGIDTPFGRKRSLYFEKKVREQTSTPTIGGMSRSTAPGGDITTRSDIGGTSVSQTQTPGGFVKQQTADMDMGGFGTAGMVKQAPQQPGQLTGTTTVTRTAAAGPKYDADAGVFGNAPAAAPATGSAVQGVGFAGAGKDVTAATPKVVTTGDASMAQQAKTMMPVSEEDDDVRVRKPGGDYVDPDLRYAQSRQRDRILSTPKGEINPDLQRYAERNVPRKLGDEGLRGIKSTGGGLGPSRIERPEGIPRVNKIPTTPFGGGGGGGGVGGGIDNPFGRKRSLYFEKKESVKESATGGASSAGAVATSIGGPGHKPTNGVPKKLGNTHKTKKIAVGKGIYDK